MPALSKMSTDLSARRLARYGLRRGAYDGANRRRFVLFESLYNGNELRREFDTKRERDDVCAARLSILRFWHGNVLNYHAAPAECWLDCSTPGQAADESVTYWRRLLNFTVPQDAARKCLQGYGAWDDLADADDDTITDRVLWLAACDYREAKARRESPLFVLE